MFNTDQIKMLEAPLDTKVVRSLPTGYGYLQAYDVIEKANEVFGRDMWSYGVENLTVLRVDEEDNKFCVVVSAIVTLEVLTGTNSQGITIKREDVGVGDAKLPQIGKAYDTACKEAVTDGLKRSLRTFGNCFGLALYDKDQRMLVDVDAQAELIRKVEELSDDVYGEGAPDYILGRLKTRNFGKLTQMTIPQLQKWVEVLTGRKHEKDLRSKKSDPKTEGNLTLLGSNPGTSS